MQEWIPKTLVSVRRAARSVVVLTGAGVSAESGIPTFREAMEGLGAKYDAYTLATPEGFAKDPALVTKWYDWRRMLCTKAELNPAHHTGCRSCGSFFSATDLIGEQRKGAILVARFLTNNPP